MVCERSASKRVSPKPPRLLSAAGCLAGCRVPMSRFKCGGGVSSCLVFGSELAASMPLPPLRTSARPP
eukprot:scaffold10402_cov96-Isochrysis_galbana.AAC.2